MRMIDDDGNDEKRGKMKIKMMMMMKMMMNKTLVEDRAARRGCKSTEDSEHTAEASAGEKR